MRKIIYTFFLLSLAIFFSCSSKYDQLLDAIEKGDVPKVKQLIDARIDVNTKTIYGPNALWIAVFDNQKEIVKLLIRANADINVKSDHEETPVWIAAYSGFAEIVKILIDAKADLNIKNKDGKTALTAAKQKGHEEIVTLLEKSGAKE